MSMLIKHYLLQIQSFIFCTLILTSAPAISGGSHDLGHAHKTGIGESADDSQADRTIEVSLQDFYFLPEEVFVKFGETVRFNLRNSGQILHEFNIGTSHMHKQHQQEMLMMFQHGMMTSKSVNVAKMNNPPGKGDSLSHDDPNSRLLEPGASADLTWTFTNSEVLEFACNIPGHYESGMVGVFVNNK